MPDTTPDRVAARLAEVRQREQAATPGEWRNEPNTGAGRVWVQIGRRRDEADCEPLFNVRALGRNPTAEEYRQRAADAGFIAHARADVPALLAALEAAMRFHAPKETANGTALCPFCSCAEGELVRAPCPEVRAISMALLGSKEGTDGDRS